MGEKTKSTAAIATMARKPHTATGEVVKRWGVPEAKALYKEYHRNNDLFFDDALGAPLLLITPSRSARTLGDYIGRDEHGLESRIRLSPKAVAQGERFAADVLLHEMVHAWCNEVAKDAEHGYRGHGPRFAEKCNAIGKALELPPVGVKSRDGLPDCAYWPMCVRPEGFYPKPFKAPTRKPSAPKEEPGDREASGDPGEPEHDDVAYALAGLWNVIGKLTPEQLQDVRDAVDSAMDDLVDDDGEIITPPAADLKPVRCVQCKRRDRIAYPPQRGATTWSIVGALFVCCATCRAKEEKRQGKVRP